MLAIAHRLVSDLADDPRLIERFAQCCADRAAERWTAMQRWRS
jgi:hypothetical protein